ncbi:MAG: thioredoxin [Sulfurimonas sp.]|jgi:thioredoxin-related protein|nr:MAG: thioredoxin [Sulfurimonas sp.]
MKNLLFIILLATTLFSANLDWPSDYDQALVDAKKQDKLIYLFITSDNCKWCKKFANTTLQDKLIKKRLHSEFITIHMSRDKHSIPKQFETAPVPRHYFTDTEGNILYSSLGHRGLPCFNAFMDNAQEQFEFNK